jgi:conjugal transfer pilin signal peptidase TrbI
MKKGLVKTLVTVSIVVAAGAYLKDRYTFAIDHQKGTHSNHKQFFIIDKWDKDIHRDNYVAFSSLRMTPYFPDGTKVIKSAAAMPGDQIKVDEAVHVNGKEWGKLIHHEKLGKKLEEFAREEVVPSGKIYALGVHVKSFDSRYWGYVDTSQVIGKAYAIY